MTVLKTLWGLIVLILLVAGGLALFAVLFALAISGVEHYAELVAALAAFFGAN